MIAPTISLIIRLIVALIAAEPSSPSREGHSREGHSRRSREGDSRHSREGRRRHDRGRERDDRDDRRYHSRQEAPRPLPRSRLAASCELTMGHDQQQLSNS